MKKENKKVIHCIQCNQTYLYEQINLFDNCLNCNEPLIYKEEIEESLRK